MAALRHAKEEAERKLQEAEGRLSELGKASEFLEGDANQKLLTALEADFDNNPDNLLAELENRATRSKELQDKLAQREEDISRLRFEESQHYIDNVKTPIQTAEERLKGVLKKDDKMYQTLMKELIYDEAGKVREGAMTADEIIRLDEIIEEDGSGLRSERVETAVTALRETFQKANEFYQNHQEKVGELTKQEELKQARENEEQAKIAKVVRAREFKQSMHEFVNDEKLQALVGKEGLETISKDIFSSTEDQIENQTPPPVKEMYGRQIKASIFDQLVAAGLLERLMEQVKQDDNYSKGSLGTGSKGSGGSPKFAGSPIDALAQSAGVGRNF